jgi:hypothetical protein
MYIFDRMFLNIGAMKAGTSWLYELLKTHPDIDSVPIKEIHFFWEKHGDFGLLGDSQRLETARYHVNRLLPETPLRAVPALLDWFKLYLAAPVDDVWLANLFTHRGERAYCAEFSNMNALLPPSGWDHIKRLTRETRVTYGVRSPVNRMWSHARFHAHIIGQYDAMAGWSAEVYARFLLESGCFRHGAYSTTIAAIHAAVGRENCLVWQFADIERDPAALLKSVEAFLAIRHVAYAPETYAVRHNETPWRAPPPAFVEAAAPVIRAELEALGRLGITVPDDLTALS